MLAFLTQGQPSPATPQKFGSCPSAQGLAICLLECFKGWENKVDFQKHTAVSLTASPQSPVWPQWGPKEVGGKHLLKSQYTTFPGIQTANICNYSISSYKSCWITGLKAHLHEQQGAQRRNTGQRNISFNQPQPRVPHSQGCKLKHQPLGFRVTSRVGQQDSFKGITAYRVVQLTMGRQEKALGEI